MSRRVLVFGPAYLDRVLRVDGPLAPADRAARPFDLSVGGQWEGETDPGALLELQDPEGGLLSIRLPDGWPEDSTGRIRLDRPLLPGSGPWRSEARGIGWADDLGGMGAGFAAALGGQLVSALGPVSDPVSARIAAMLAEQGVSHRPARVAGAGADWTLLVSSGPHGDKLPIGFRGCHSALDGFPNLPTGPVDVLVVASLTNRLLSSAIDAVDARVKVLAPTLRNMTDNDPPVSRFADRIDMLCCNRQEWEALADRDRVTRSIPVVSITDGAEGGIVRFRDLSGNVQEHREPAFPRGRPPRDTNRAGEAYASTLLGTLLDLGWTTGPVSADLASKASRRASAAAALVLDREEFGFPSPEEIEQALDRGRIE